MYDAMDEIVTHRGYGNNVAKYKKYENLLSQHCRDSLCRLIEDHKLPEYLRSNQMMGRNLSSLQLSWVKLVHCKVLPPPDLEYKFQD